MPTKKLIEVALPIKEISAESVRDKSIRHGHISTLHLWWARRPLPVCRAVVFASLVPDPLDEECPPAFREAVDLLLGRAANTGDPYKPYTDLHHLRAADRSVNTYRSARSFDMCDEFYYDNKTVWTPSRFSTNWTWEPPDETKGDIARMLFYMAVRYEGPDYDLELVDEIVPRNGKEPLMGKLSTLLEWHRFDPVDDMERRRNNLIQNKYQGNRNPFIDHPEWAFEIWGEPALPDF